MKNIIAIKALVCLLVMLLSWRCEKVSVPEPTSVDETPVFVADLDVGGQTIDLSAGKDDYFMDASFEEDDAGVLIFVGTLRPKACTARLCPRSLRIIIRDFQKFDPANFNVNASLSRGELPFVQAFRNDSVRIKFKDQSLSPNAAFKSTWSFGNGDRAEIPNPISVFAIDELYNVRLQIASQFGCMSEQEQTIDPSGKRGCFARLAFADNGSKVRVRAQGVAPFSYKWNNGSIDSIAAFDVAVASAKIISVTVTDADGCVSSSSVDLSELKRDNDRCIAHFGYEQQGNPTVHDQENLGKVTIQYIDDQETLFRSNVFRQPADASFQVLSIEDFIDNEKGQKTKKLELAFSCLLWNEDHSQHIRLRGKSVFAIAYPG
ncbi:MAG: hypothetical protein OEQ53_00110 [Saprospiraceae bacterium]|nr:hypothetical protein [Saprospiraceae bacterium]